MLCHATLVRLAASALVAMGLVTAPALAQDVADPLGVPGPIAFDGKEYLLAWSSQPTPDYTKQEYVPAGDSVETYDSMIMVEFIVADLTPLDMAAAQVDVLNERKASDPLVNMDLIQNDQTGEVLLDFIVSSRDQNGQIIVEWNAYRYASAETTDGEMGGLLFAVSHRAYGDDASRAFMTKLSALRTEQLQALASAPLPAL